MLKAIYLKVAHQIEQLGIGKYVNKQDKKMLFKLYKTQPKSSKFTSFGN